jgi:four helix bundle protein
MATLKRFEDVEAWKKARVLTRSVYEATASGSFARDYALRDQIRRASCSIMSNIAEGFERGGDKEFRQFLALAKGSAGESRSQLYVALDAGYINQEQFDALYDLMLETSRLISGFIKYLGDSAYKGNKYK